MAAWGSGYPSVARLSKVIMAVYGPHRMMVREQRFHFLYPAQMGFDLPYRIRDLPNQGENGEMFETLDGLLTALLLISTTQY